MKPIYRCRRCGKYVEEPWHCGVEAELVLDPRRRVMLSKLVSGLLRHFPGEAGLTPDREGWVSIDELVEAIKYRWRNRGLYQWVGREHIIAVAITDPKCRFEVDGNRIRARYGHSIEISIDYPVVEPPPRLYHGTSMDRIPGILRKGILPMKRKYVHLTIDPRIALETGRRHGRPVVIIVNGRCLEEKNITLYKATDKIYLVRHVPVECIEKIMNSREIDSLVRRS